MAVRAFLSTSSGRASFIGGFRALGDFNEALPSESFGSGSGL